MLQFTENHQFYIFRHFSLSALDESVLAKFYQPMVGAYALSVYRLLYQQITAEKAGYSALDQQRTLFLSLDLEPSEKGRKFFIDQTSRLEAVGLLNTHRKYSPEADDYVYVYHLQPPLSPGEFFNCQHLLLLLRDKIGKHAVMHLQGHILLEEEEGLAGLQGEDLTVPFYDIFRLNTTTVDEELEQASKQIAAGLEARVVPQEHKGFEYADIITRFPKQSLNRKYVERLKHEPEQLAAINYAAYKYRLSLMETCRLLDEDDIFTADGQFDHDRFLKKASAVYKQDQKREDERTRYLHKLNSQIDGEGGSESSDKDGKGVDPAYYLPVPALFEGQCDIHQYNFLINHEPYTHFLRRFFPGTVPAYVSNIFDTIDINYRLTEEVTNVLIHYLHVNNLPWNKPFIESIASDMLGRQISTFEQAVTYIREYGKKKEKAASPKEQGKTGRYRGGARKPKIPVVSNADVQIETVSDEEYEEFLKEARAFDNHNSSK
jgi:replication initiation and membrane attachment protein